MSILDIGLALFRMFVYSAVKPTFQVILILQFLNQNCDI